jgi:hypothetical protein
MAVVFAADRPGWQRALFVVFVVIAVAAFMILLGAGVQGIVVRVRSQRAKGSVVASQLRVSPAVESPALASESVAVQENEATGSASLFGVMDGDLIIHGEGSGQQPATPPGSRRTAPNSSRTQRNVVRDNAQLFAVHTGDLHLHRSPSQQPPESSAGEGQEHDGRT